MDNQDITQDITQDIPQDITQETDYAYPIYIIVYYLSWQNILSEIKTPNWKKYCIIGIIFLCMFLPIYYGISSIFSPIVEPNNTSLDPNNTSLDPSNNMLDMSSNTPPPFTQNYIVSQIIQFITDTRNLFTDTTPQLDSSNNLVDSSNNLVNHSRNLVNRSQLLNTQYEIMYNNSMSKMTVIQILGFLVAIFIIILFSFNYSNENDTGYIYPVVENTS